MGTMEHKSRGQRVAVQFFVKPTQDFVVACSQVIIKSLALKPSASSISLSFCLDVVFYLRQRSSRHANKY